MYASPARVAFEADFKAGVASSLGLGVTSDQIVIVGVSTGIVVDFYITSPPPGVDLAAIAAVSTTCVATVGSLSVGPSPAPACDLRADLDASGVVDIRDLLMVLSYFNVRC